MSEVRISVELVRRMLTGFIRNEVTKTGHERVVVGGFLRSARHNATAYRPAGTLVRKLRGYTRRNPLPDQQAMREKLLEKHRA